MKDLKRKIKEKLAIGEPPRLITTLLLGTWLVLVPSVTELCQFVVLVYQPKTYEAGRKWEFFGFNRILLAGSITVSNSLVRLVATLVAPFVDKYKLLRHFYIASLATGTIGFVATAALALFADIPNQKITLYFFMPLVMSFFEPFVLSFTARQFKDSVGAKTRLLFTVFYTAQHAFVGVCTAAFFPEAPKHPAFVLRCILSFSVISALLSLGLLIASWVFIYKMKWLVAGDYQTEETHKNLACLAKGACYFKKKNRFDSLLKMYDQKTVHETKKVAKVLLVLLATSYQMSTVEFWPVACVKQFTITAAWAMFFSKIEFVTMTNLLAAVLIPVVQYGMVPHLRKFKLPLPLYSMLICIGYVCLSMGFTASVIIRGTAGRPAPRYDPKSNEAQYYLFNAMDTHTYVSEGGLSRDVLPPGSIKSLTLKVGKKLHIMNFWYDVYWTKRIKSYQDDLIVCSSQGVYQEYLGDFGWVDGYSASHFGVPKLTILCPKHPQTGDPPDFCDEKTEFLVLKGNSIVRKLNMINGSEPYNTTLELEPGHPHSVQVDFHGKALNVENQDISFTPKQGAWYAFVVWSGDVHLKIKYNLVTIKEGFKVDTLSALPQIFSSALGLSLYEVVISCMIHINTPDSLSATTWALHCLLERIVSPVFVLLLIFRVDSFWCQAIIVLLGLLFFLGLLAALRIARYW